jgi:hypothetical protein
MGNVGRQRVRYVSKSLCGYFKIFANATLLAVLSTLCCSLALGLMYAYSFLPSAERMLELYILVDINSPVPVDTARCYSSSASLAPRRNGEPNSRLRARGGCRAALGGPTRSSIRISAAAAIPISCSA